MLIPRKQNVTTKMMMLQDVTNDVTIPWLCIPAKEICRREGLSLKTSHTTQIFTHYKQGKLLTVWPINPGVKHIIKIEIKVNNFS